MDPNAVAIVALLKKDEARFLTNLEYAVFPSDISENNFTAMRRVFDQPFVEVTEIAEEKEICDTPVVGEVSPPSDTHGRLLDVDSLRLTENAWFALDGEELILKEIMEMDFVLHIR